MRYVVFLAIAMAIFAIPNVVTWRALFAFHPRRRRAIWTALIAANLFWPLLPIVFRDRANDLSRWVRSILGPVWFTGLLFVILYALFVLLVALVWLAVARRKRSFGEFGRLPSTVLLSALALLWVAGMYQALVPLEVRHVRVPLEGLPQSFSGYRIALLSDLHVGLFTRPSRLEKISRTVSSLRPDVAVYDGDLVDDDPHFVPKFARGLDALDAQIPVIAVLGNHEIYVDAHEVVRRLRSEPRMRLLVNEGELVERGGDAIWLAGISDYAAGQMGRAADLRPDFDRALAGRPEHAFPIVLAHQPRAFPESIERRLPLTLSGHSHGGQFGIRPLGWTFAGVFIPYHMGLYREGMSWLYVTTGAGYWLVPFRFGLPPEIVVIELQRG
jgi:uncharacterized protein